MQLLACMHIIPGMSGLLLALLLFSFLLLDITDCDAILLFGEPCPDRVYITHYIRPP